MRIPDIPPRLLLVEDDGITAKLTKNLLERYGYSVDWVASGEEAVRKTLDCDSFDLILMDIDLGPGIAGTEAARRIIQVKTIPILFVSSHTEREVVDLTKEISSYGYVVKNTGVAVLDASIKMVLNLAEAKKALEQSQKELAAILEALPDLLFEVNSHGVILNFYSTRSDLLLVQPETFLGRAMKEFLPPEAESILMEALGAKARGEDPGAVLYQLELPQGHRWFEVTFSQKSQDGGTFLMLSRDVTNRVSAEKALAQSAQKYRRLVENLPQIIYMYQPGVGALYWSPRVRTILGLDPNSLVDNPLLWHDSIHPEDRVVVDQVLAGLQPGTGYQLTYRIRDMAGQWHRFLDESLGAYEEDGHLVVEGAATDLGLVTEAGEFIQKSGSVHY